MWRFAISLDEKFMAITYDRDIKKEDAEDEYDTDTFHFVTLIWIDELKNLFDPGFNLEEKMSEGTFEIMEEFN
jgi:hypothetical protein